MSKEKTFSLIGYQETFDAASGVLSGMDGLDESLQLAIGPSSSLSQLLRQLSILYDQDCRLESLEHYDLVLHHSQGVIYARLYEDGEAASTTARKNFLSAVAERYLSFNGRPTFDGGSSRSFFQKLWRGGVTR